MSDNKNATGKKDTTKSNTNAEEEKDLASKPVVDAKAIYGEPPAADREDSTPENEAATEQEEA